MFPKLLFYCQKHQEHGSSIMILDEDGSSVMNHGEDGTISQTFHQKRKNSGIHQSSLLHASSTCIGFGFSIPPAVMLPDHQEGMHLHIALLRGECVHALQTAANGK
jgi:hypothetical protein